MPKIFKFIKWSGKKAVAFFVLTIVVATVAVGSTLAYIITQTEPLKNEFTPPILDITMNLDIDGGNVVENTGDIPVYVRAAIVATWVSEDDANTVLSTAPEEGTDYTVELNENWIPGSDGFYYYSLKLNSEEKAELIKSFTQSKSIDGYKLQLQVLSSAIQATPAEAVTSSWPAVSVDTNGNLVAAGSN